MVVVTKIPDTEDFKLSTTRENLKQTTITATRNDLVEDHLDLCEDVPLKASVLKPAKETTPVQIHSDLNTCKILFKQALKERNKALLNNASNQLISLISITTVLEIFSFLNGITPFNDEPSAPPYSPTNEYHPDYDWTISLQTNITKCQEECHRLIDEKTVEILIFDEVKKLSYSDLLAILKRDTLNVFSEEFLYNVMYEWAKLNGTFGELPLYIRFGTMKLKTFKKLKGIKEVLSEKDIRAIKFYLEEKSRERDTRDLPYRWSEPRKQSQPDHHPLAKNRKLERAGMYCLMCWMFVFD